MLVLSTDFFAVLFCFGGLLLFLAFAALYTNNRNGRSYHYRRGAAGNRPKFPLIVFLRNDGDCSAVFHIEADIAAVSFGFCFLRTCIVAYIYGIFDFFSGGKPTHHVLLITVIRNYY